jgi:hypothetical protein
MSEEQSAFGSTYAAGYEEGKREGRKAGLLEAAVEVATAASQIIAMAVQRDTGKVLQVVAAHLREKADRL